MKKSLMRWKEVFFVSILLITAVILIAVVVQKKNAVSTALWNTVNCEICVFYLQPNDPKLFFAIGNHYFGGGAYDINRATFYYKQALALDPKLPGLHYQLSRTDFIQGDFSSAIDEINKELALYPDFKRSYYVRGLIYGYSKQYVKAEADFKEFLKWKPESWAGHNDLAWVYFMEGDYKNSAATAREGLKYVPNNVWLENSLGVALLNEGNLTEAKKALTDALTSANAMTPADWGRSYPGNNPSVYGDGLDAMKASINRNLALIAAKK